MLLEFELTFHDVIIQHYSDNTSGTPNISLYIYIYIYIYIETADMVDFGKSFKMIKISGKVDKSDT